MDIADPREAAAPLLASARRELVITGAQQQLGDASLARLAGLSPREWAKWRALARVEEALFDRGMPLGQHAALMREVDTMRAEGEMLLTQTVFFGAVGTDTRPADPKLALEILARRNPAEWAPMSKFRIDQGEAEEMSEVLAVAAIGAEADRTVDDIDVEMTERAEIEAGDADVEAILDMIDSPPDPELVNMTEVVDERSEGD